MLRYATPLLRLITHTAAWVALLAVLLPVGIHAYLDWDHINKRLDTELRIHTLFLNKFISNQPLVWGSAGIRMQSLLEDIHASGTSVQVFARHKGQEIEAGALPERLPWPRLTRQSPLYDYGEPVGRVEITLSMRAELLPILWTLGGALLLGWVVFFPLRIMTLRIVRQAMDALMQAKDLAEEAKRTQADFFANMSHEIRTPMNAVIGLTGLALQGEGAPRTRDYLKKIASSSHALLRILNDLLDFAKIDAGRLALETMDFRLGELFVHLDELFRLQAEEKRLRWRITPGENAALLLHGDPMRLEQVLINLIANALKFTPSGGVVEVGIQEVARLESGLRLHFFVRDTGIGIAPEQAARLFQPFVQADHSTTRKHGGTGLGLAICKNLVELMGGEIWLESLPGEGTTFHFTTVFSRSGPQDGADSVILVSPWQRVDQTLDLQPLRNRLAGARVLLAEDNAINRQVAEENLRSVGIVVEAAENGLEAVRKVTLQTFDLVLMDVQMPEMDGYAATRLIRANARFQDLPVLAMTAHAMEADRQASLEAGMNGHLTKPIDRKLLFDALLAWIHPREGLGVAGLEESEKPEEPGVVADAPVVPDHLDGVDLPAALERLNGNWPLWQQLIRQFCADYAQAPEQLRQVLSDPSPEGFRQIERLLHTIKGGGANLAAVDLQAAARALEQAVKNRDSGQWSHLLTRFSRELYRLSALAAQLPADAQASFSSSASFAPTHDPVRLAELLRELASALQCRDLNAETWLQELRPFLAHEEEHRIHARMTEALDRYDFDRTATELLNLARVLECSGPVLQEIEFLLTSPSDADKVD
ncbi:MAG: response regulator [Magnetococcales bacterium]|nr:response regulator [Magnetococcales bacterium]